MQGCVAGGVLGVNDIRIRGRRGLRRSGQEGEEEFQRFCMEGYLTIRFVEHDREKQAVLEVYRCAR